MTTSVKRRRETRNNSETIGRYGDGMNLAPSETEKLLMAVAGMIARDRLARGVRLNYPESVALLSTWVIERAREGSRVEELMVSGREVLTRDEVMDGVAEMLSDVQVEATFPDGRKLVTLHQPIQ
jgi:urease subunit gamma